VDHAPSSWLLPWHRRSWQYSCNLAGVPRALTYLTSALLLLTLAAYFALLAVAQRQLAARPYCVYRVGNILLRVQVGGAVGCCGPAARVACAG
jgi:hypothetical protein